MKVMVYHGNDGIDIEYIFRKHASASDVMIVSFPGAHGAIGNAGMWGYMLTLNKCNANVLFVRSNEEFSKSRMTFRNRKPIIESAVISLVQKCAKACNAKRIIAIGSSMGGFCALYYGLKYDWDIVAGSPPYTFLSDRSVQYATGGSGEEEKAWINEQMPILMERAGNRGYQKKLFLIFGEGEPFWCSEEHGKKLISDLNASNLPYECKLYPFAVHATIHSLFPSVLEGILDHQFHIVEGNAKKDVEALPPSIRVEVAWEAGCVAFLSSLDQMDPSKEPYFPIKAYKHYGTKDPWTALRNFVYAQNGWLWVKNEVHPRKVKNADFWASAISLDKTSAIGFLLQDGILNYCERHEDSDAMLEWCMETTKEYLLRDPQWGHYTSTFYRIHYFIALHQWMKRKDRKEEWEEKISRDIVANLKHLSLRRGVMSLLWKYRFVLLLLHVALYYSKDEEFFQKAYSSALFPHNILSRTHFRCKGRFKKI